MRLGIVKPRRNVIVSVKLCCAIITSFSYFHRYYYKDLVDYRILILYLHIANFRYVKPIKKHSYIITIIFL